MSLFGGIDEEYQQMSNLTGSQIRNQRQLEQAGRQRGAGGAFGQAADYWRDILSNDPGAFAQFEAPHKRQFQEQIIPDLAEQFAGMGAGNLSSSGFRNAAVGAGTDLAERLAAMRANLRQNAAQSLFGLGQAGLNQHAQYQQTNTGSEGFGPAISQGIGQAIPGAISGLMIGGPWGAAAGAAGGFASGALQGSGAFGRSSPYGSQGVPSANTSGYKGSFGPIPNYMAG